MQVKFVSARERSCSAYRREKSCTCRAMVCMTLSGRSFMPTTAFALLEHHTVLKRPTRHGTACDLHNAQPDAKCRRGQTDILPHGASAA